MRRSFDFTKFVEDVRFKTVKLFCCGCLLFLTSCGARYPRALLPDSQSASTTIQLKQVPEASDAVPAEKLLESDLKNIARGDTELRACVAFLFARPSFRSSKLDVLCINFETKKEIYRFTSPAAASDTNLRDILRRTP